jgi:hypothetical protein
MEKQWFKLLSHTDPSTLIRYFQSVFPSLLSSCSLSIQNQCLAEWNKYCRWNDIPLFILESTMIYLNLSEMKWINILCHSWRTALNKYAHLWSHILYVKINSDTHCILSNSILSLLPRLTLNTEALGNLQRTLLPNMPNVKAICVRRCFLSTEEAMTIGTRFSNVTSLKLTGNNQFKAGLIDRFTTLAFLKSLSVNELISTDVIACPGPLFLDYVPLPIFNHLCVLALILHYEFLQIECVRSLLESSQNSLQRVELKQLNRVGLSVQGDSWNTALLLISQLSELRILKLHGIVIPESIQPTFLYNLNRQIHILQLMGNYQFFDFSQLNTAPFLHVTDLLVEFPTCNKHFECLISIFPNITHLDLSEPYYNYAYTCTDLLVLRKLLLLQRLHLYNSPIEYPLHFYSPIICKNRSELEYQFNICQQHVLDLENKIIQQ